MSDLSREAPSLDGREVAAVAVRRARTSDVPEIKRLVDTYAGKILLEKNLVTLYEAVQEFWVAEMDDRVVGCGALHVLWADLGEVRTVAVDPAVKGRGVGHAIVGEPGAHVHLYGKSEHRRGRKMGHVKRITRSAGAL